MLVIVVLGILTPTTLHAQEPSPAIVIKPENKCSSYNGDHYPCPQSVEDGIIGRMGGRIYSLHTGESFASKRETDFGHVVIVSEAHDSGLCAANAATRRVFPRDLDNLTLASPALNRYQKVANDVAEWLAALNQCWFVARVVAVRKKHGLSMDTREDAAVLNVLADCVNLEKWTRDELFDYLWGEKGQTSTANRRNQSSSWLRFPWRGSFGWVYAPLMIISNASGLPVIATTSATIGPSPTATFTPMPTRPNNCLEAHAMGMSNMTSGRRCW